MGSAFPETNISIIVDGIFAVGDAVDLSSIVLTALFAVGGAADLSSIVGGERCRESPVVLYPRNYLLLPFSHFANLTCASNEKLTALV